MSHVVDRLCSWYPHVTIAAALDTPYRVIWQLWQRKLEALDPEYKQHAPAVLEARQKYLEDLAAKLSGGFESQKEKTHGKRT